MKKWQYANVVYNRQRKPSETCLDFSHIPEMSNIHPSKGLYVDIFLKAAGEAGWELATIMLPFSRGKELSTGTNGEDDTESFFVKDPLDIQWLIFKRET